MVLRAPGELAVLQGEGGALPDKLFHNESKLLDTNTGDRDRSIGKIDPDGPCHKVLDDIKAQDHADHWFLVIIGRGHTPVKILFRLRLQKLCPLRKSTTTCKGTAHGL